MKKTIKLAVTAAMILGTTSAFATNGDHMIGLSAESRALGGTGIANAMGSANALTNPALLAKMKGKDEFIFAGTIFDATVKASTTDGYPMMSGVGVDRESPEGASVIPAISLSHRINNDLVFGLGMYGTAGLGTDWRDGDTAHTGMIGFYNMRSSLMLMQFAPSLAYGSEIFGIGVTAIVQYGALSVDYDTHDGAGNRNHIGSGISNDIGYGYQIGAYYNPLISLTLGAIYKSAIDMEYDHQISDASLAFGYGSNPGAMAAKGDHLEQPAEFGFGVAYDIDAFALTMDVKQIMWSDAKGYEDFGWDDQTVYAIGGKYSADSYWVGLGFNYGENPVPNNTSTESVWGTSPGMPGNMDGDTMNLFNYAMFPATVESTITVGGGYALSDNLGLDAAYTYSPEVSDTVSTTSVGTGDLTTKHSQQALTIAVKFNF